MRVFILLVLVLVADVAAGQIVPIDSVRKKYKTAEYLRILTPQTSVFAEPSKSSERVNRIEKDEVVLGYRKVGDFWWVKAPKGRSGYIHNGDAEPASSGLLERVTEIAQRKAATEALVQEADSVVDKVDNALVPSSEVPKVDDTIFLAAILAEEKKQTELAKETEFNTRVVMIIQVVGVVLTALGLILTLGAI